MGHAKLPIFRISSELSRQPGFDSRGCLGTDCEDECCRYGADVDRQSYEAIQKHKDLVERRTGSRFQDLFLKEWLPDTEYPGGGAIRSSVGADGYCVFHIRNGRGCNLFKLALSGQAPIKIVPAICRTYPVQWDAGELKLSSHKEPRCNCYAADNPGTRSAWETQKEAILDLFELHCKPLEPSNDISARGLKRTD